METGILLDFLIILLLGMGVLLIFQRLKIPEIVGFFLTGIIAGPGGLGLISSLHEVEIVAEVGVILLLFTIGIEFSLKNLMNIRRIVLIGGSLQVFLTILFVIIAGRYFGKTYTEAVFLGYLIALSSTAMVLKILQERDEILSAHGRIAVAILIFQDIMVIPMMLTAPLLSGRGIEIDGSLLLLLLKSALIIIMLIAITKWIAPFILLQITKTRSRELFLFGIIGICLGVAYLTNTLGISLALGAFIAGLVISESEYAHHAFGNVVPIRDLFASFFFISIGMLLDLGFVIQNILLIVLIAAGIMAVKAVIVGAAAFALGFRFHAQVLASLALVQIGEFSFILSKIGLDEGIINIDTYQMFIAVAIITIICTPFLISAAPKAAEIIGRFPLPSKIKKGLTPIPLYQLEGIEKHIIIVGFGVNGRNVAKAARASNIPYIIIEMNPITVQAERRKGEMINYGDATQETALTNALINKAEVIVIAIPSAAATARITELAKRLNPNIFIAARTRFVQNVQQLYKLGADEVIPEEFETSIEIFSIILKKYGIEKEKIDYIREEIRRDCYSMFRRINSEKHK